MLEGVVSRNTMKNVKSNCLTSQMLEVTVKIICTSRTHEQALNLHEICIDMNRFITLQSHPVYM